MPPHRSVEATRKATHFGLDDAPEKKAAVHRPRILRRPRSATTQRATANEKRQQNILGNSGSGLEKGAFITPTAFEFQQGVLQTASPRHRDRKEGRRRAASGKKHSYGAPSIGKGPPSYGSGAQRHIAHVRSDLENLHTLIQQQKHQAGKNIHETERLARAINSLAAGQNASPYGKMRRPQSAPHKRSNDLNTYSNYHNARSRSPNSKPATGIPSEPGPATTSASEYEINVVRPAMKQLRALLHSGQDVGPILAYLSGSGPVPECPRSAHSASKTIALSDSFKARTKEMASNAERNGQDPEQSLKRAFAQFDSKQSGSLSVEELTTCMQALQVPSVWEHDIQEYVNKNPDGCCVAGQFLYRRFIRDVTSSFEGPHGRTGIGDTFTLCPYCRRKM